MDKAQISQCFSRSSVLLWRSFRTHFGEEEGGQTDDDGNRSNAHRWWDRGEGPMSALDEKELTTICSRTDEHDEEDCVLCFYRAVGILERGAFQDLTSKEFIRNHLKWALEDKQ